MTRNNFEIYIKYLKNLKKTDRVEAKKNIKNGQ